MRTTTALLLLALPLAALAQDGGRAAKFEAQLEQRFAAADANGDGQLTRDEAKAGMPRVYKQFDAIDANHKGFVTLDEIRAAVQTRMAARGGGRGGAGTGTP
jgi:Ca2+-binding EF-hand superfamily protein